MDTLAALAALTTRTVALLPEEVQGQLSVREVAPGTPGALEFKVRRVDSNSISVLALRAVFDQHELVALSRRAAQQAQEQNQEAHKDGPPAPPEEHDPDGATLLAMSNSVSLHAVLQAAMEEPTYQAAKPKIHGTAIEHALYLAVIHWSPELQDPKTPAPS